MGERVGERNCFRLFFRCPECLLPYTRRKREPEGGEGLEATQGSGGGAGPGDGGRAGPGGGGSSPAPGEGAGFSGSGGGGDPGTLTTGLIGGGENLDSLNLGEGGFGGCEDTMKVDR